MDSPRPSLLSRRQHQHHRTSNQLQFQNDHRQQSSNPGETSTFSEQKDTTIPSTAIAAKIDRFPSPTSFSPLPTSYTPLQNEQYSPSLDSWNRRQALTEQYYCAAATPGIHPLTYLEGSLNPTIGLSPTSTVPASYFSTAAQTNSPTQPRLPTIMARRQSLSEIRASNPDLSLSGNIISATFNIPHNFTYQKSGDWVRPRSDLSLFALLQPR